MVGDSPAFRQSLNLLRQLKKTDMNLLLTGPSGSGKDLAAWFVHDEGLRVGKPFVEVSSGNLPTLLAESELFGHKRGAFTGAIADRKGAFEVANEGTLLLNEIGDMDPEIQVKILRAIQHGVIQRLGETRDIHVDVRVIAATWKDLSVMVEDGKFREDLYYRLAVGLVELPPLIERGNDVVLIARHLLKMAPKKHNLPRRSLSHAGAAVLRAYRWPGNVRELEHVLHRALATGAGRSLSASDIERAIRQTSGERVPELPLVRQELSPLEILDCDLPVRAVDLRAELGVSRTTLSRMIKPLIDSGRVVREGRGVATCYRLNDRIISTPAIDPRWDAVLVLVRQEGSVTRRQLAAALEVSERTSTRLLRGMVDAGRLQECGGRGRGAAYSLPPTT